jgi:hypothetical protein
MIDKQRQEARPFFASRHHTDVIIITCAQMSRLASWAARQPTRSAQPPHVEIARARPPGRPAAAWGASDRADRTYCASPPSALAFLPFLAAPPAAFRLVAGASLGTSACGDRPGRGERVGGKTTAPVRAPNTPACRRHGPTGAWGRWAPSSPSWAWRRRPSSSTRSSSRRGRRQTCCAVWHRVRRSVAAHKIAQRARRRARIAAGWNGRDTPSPARAHCEDCAPSGAAPPTPARPETDLVARVAGWVAGCLSVA